LSVCTGTKTCYTISKRAVRGARLKGMAGDDTEIVLFLVGGICENKDTCQRKRRYKR